GFGGEPRVVKSGVVGGSFFEVMGLRPVLGRLLNSQDDGPRADAVAVLTYRFWTTSLNGDPGVVGKTIPAGPHEILADVAGRPPSPRRHDGHQPHAPNDGALRPPRARDVPRRGARRA